MKRIYFHRDSERGATRTHEWLMEEVEELGEAIKEGDTQAIKDEFADVLAWLASLANVMHIDLEKAALKKYDNQCPKCKKERCNCPL